MLGIEGCKPVRTRYASFDRIAIPAKVADASVIGAIAFGEPQQDQARALIEGNDLHAPTLLYYELASIARTKIRQDPDHHDEILSSLLDALAMGIELHDASYVAITRLALDTGLSTYDASYLHLARHLRVPLVTFDRRLQRAAEGG